MKKLDPVQTIAILANLGVIAGIAFLAFELQQANRIAIASTQIDIRNNFSSINETIYTAANVAELLAKTIDPNAALATVERIRIGSMVRRFMNVWLAIEIAYENGLGPYDTYSVIQDDARGFLSSYPATMPEWRSVVDAYPGQNFRETH